MRTALRHPALQIGAAAILGVVTGLVLGDAAGELKFVGDLFIRLIQMSIVPLVMASVIVATGGMTGSGMGRLAGRTFGWMIGFSCVAAVIGWLLAVALRPGEGMVFDVGSTRRSRSRPRRPRAGRTRCSGSSRPTSSRPCRPRA